MARFLKGRQKAVGHTFLVEAWYFGCVLTGNQREHQPPRRDPQSEHAWLNTPEGALVKVTSRVHRYLPVSSLTDLHFHVHTTWTKLNK